MHSVTINQDKITDQNEINKQIFSFYQPLFSRKIHNRGVFKKHTATKLTKTHE